MSDTKKYDVGQINIDLLSTTDDYEAPFVYYTHELPLLSFGDVQHSVNLSLIFNYERYREENNSNENPFLIAPGYKLNIQKQFTYSQYGIFTKFKDESGKTVDLERYYDRYTFKDDSQRILRKTERAGTPTPIPGGNIDADAGDPIYDFILEYPDSSKEYYNEGGNITAVYDKYSNDPFLTYTYESGRLTAVTFNDSRVIYLNYTSNRLESITYAQRKIKFFYKSNGMLNYIEIFTLNETEQSTGLRYEFTLSRPAASLIDVNFDYKISAVENGIVLHSKELSLTEEGYTIQINDKKGNTTVNTVSYRNPISLIHDHPPFSHVDIIDNNGVETRVQFRDRKAFCSYEIKDGAPQFSGDSMDAMFLGNVNCYDAIGASKNKKTSRVQTLQDGNKMICTLENGNHVWPYNLYYVNTKRAYYTLSGWIKNDDINAEKVTISIKDKSDEDNHNIQQYEIMIYNNLHWQYFSILFYIEADEIIISTPNINNVVFRDFRVTFCGSNNEADDQTPHVSMSENILINESGEIYIDNAEFYYTLNGTDCAIEDVSMADIAKYKLRKKKTGSSSEIYYENCAKLIIGATDLKVLYNGSPVSVSNFDLGVRTYSGNKESLTRIIIDENNQSTDIVKTYTVDETLVSTETFNNYLDVKESTGEGITVYYDYVSSNSGLISKQTYAPVGISKDNTNHAKVFVKSYIYDSQLTKIESTVDEFGNTTYYTTDDVWGTVTKIILPDNSVVTDTYDFNSSLLTKREFSNSSNSTNSRFTTFAYLDNKLAGITHGNDTNSIAYGFSYTTDNELLSVSKNNVSIEQHSYAKDDGATEVVSSYPSSDIPLFTETTHLDKYGRLASVTGLVQNEYLIDPRWTYLSQDDDNDISNDVHKTMEDYDRSVHGNLSHSSAGEDGKDAALSKSTDSLSGEYIKYGYYYGKLTAAVTYNSNNSLKKQETFVYDNAGRMTKNHFEYDLTGGKSVTSELTYATTTDVPFVDNRVSICSYKVNGTVKAKTQNRYNDNYKRLTAKLVTVGSVTYDKGLNYNKTRISQVMDVKNGSMFHNVSYSYDSMGRIASEVDSIDTNINNTYFYDSFGQLIRENNKALDKTFIYSYNEIGNITSVKEYSYTTGAVSGTPVTKSFGYNTTHPDRLTSFGGKAISYNINGCPISYDGRSYSWNRGKLSRIHRGSSTQAGALYEYCNFSYDGYGRRKSKSYSYDSNPGSTSDYSYSYNTTYEYDTSGRLIHEKCIESYTYTGGTSRTREITYLYDESGIIGAVQTYNNATETFYFDRNILGDVIGIYNSSGTKIASYTYDAFGNCTTKALVANNFSAYNPIRYRGYYYDRETKLYYLNARYYNPEWRRFISPDDSAFLDPEAANGLNLYCYCGNDPVNFIDPNGNAPWWSWVLSGLQLVVGSAMFFVPGLQVTGFSLAIGGALGLMMNALDPGLVQLIGGANSVANGRAAASTGISLMSLGGWASVVGAGLLAVGIGTMIFGANEMVAAITGTNYIKKGLGMSDAAYAWAYLGLNLVSSVGQMAGSIYRLHVTRKTRFGYDNQPNGYRYYNEKGDPFFDFDYPHGNIEYNHWHGWSGPGLTGRTDKEHWSYLELILWMLGGG